MSVKLSGECCVEKLLLKTLLGRNTVSWGWGREEVDMEELSINLHNFWVTNLFFEKLTTWDECLENLCL